MDAVDIVLVLESSCPYNLLTFKYSKYRMLYIYYIYIYRSDLHSLL